MRLVIYVEEQEPNMPVIKFENKFLDLNSYSYNQTLVTSNVDTNLSSVTTSSSSRDSLTTKLKTKRNFAGNVYNLDQNNADGIYELEITSKKIGSTLTSN